MRLKGGNKKKIGVHRRAVDFFLFLFCRSETVWFGRLETLCRPPAWKNSGIQYDSSAYTDVLFLVVVSLVLPFLFWVFFKRSCASFCVVPSLQIVTIPKRSGIYLCGWIWWSKPSICIRIIFWRSRRWRVLSYRPGEYGLKPQYARHAMYIPDFSFFQFPCSCVYVVW